VEYRLRTLLALLLVVGSASGCDFLTPPCTKVARAVCDVGVEGDSCAFVLDRSRDDRISQDLCTEILPAAKALKADPSSGSARADWAGAREKLVTLGFRADAKRGTIEDKIKRMGGVEGHLVQRLDENTKEAERVTTEGAERALEGAK